MQGVRWLIAGLLAAGGAVCSPTPDSPTSKTGRLELRIIDPVLGEEVPARVELLDEGGNAFVPPQALGLRFECISAPPPDWAAPWLIESDRVWNRHDGSDQFYLEGRGEMDLPEGSYRLRVFKGIEYDVAQREIAIVAGETARVEIPLERWIDMPAEGWWSVDDHVHITRRTREEERSVGAWMRAEDLHVANLLQMGTVDQHDVTPQYAFGDEGEFRYGDTLLLAGQEHPRTHFLGHTITLGADERIDRREAYIVYETTFRAALAANGLPGFAHWAIGPARDGLSIDAPRDLVFFVEVLQFDFPWYDAWYDMLDLGLRIAPTAGTDFPCGFAWGVPGRERFYVKLDAPPTRRTFLDAVRAGRTFVTNGPLLELRVGEVGIGEDVVLDTAGPLPVVGRVRFDPERDAPERIELIVNGETVPALHTELGPGEIRVETELDFPESAWVALRVEGSRLGETRIDPAPLDWANSIADRIFDFREMGRVSQAYYAGRDRVRPSAAHTAPVYVTVGGRGLEASERARRVARASLARLDDLEARLAPGRVEEQTLWDWFPYSDAVPLEHLERNRPGLLQAIEEARQRYRSILGE